MRGWRRFFTWQTVKREKKLESEQAGNVFQFTLAGLIIFSLALLAGASLIGFKLAPRPRTDLLHDMTVVDPKDKSHSIHVGPWGELSTRDIQLERPAEFLTDEVSRPQPESWTFNGLSVEDVKSQLSRGGLSAAQIEVLFAPASVRSEKGGTVLTPSADCLLSLDAGTRRRLYEVLTGHNVNLYWDYPFIFPGTTIDGICHDARLNPADTALLKQLVYTNGNSWQLSDYPLLVCQIPTVERRVAMARALSRQSAVFAGLIIKPDTDIDKIAAYWGNVPNVRFTDVKPLLEALKALPDGGYLSLFYLLPKFARDRLYTYPLPPQPGEPQMDCHWTTFNFSNETPDNRFNDTSYTVEYLLKNYYQIAAPSMYGDIFLLVNERNEIKHSAVYLADDLVFTKNGNNYRQPWMLMRIPDLLATYSAVPPMKVVYMRLKTD